eukprot:GAHX01003285.1.p1 GENE.GAHX01003285.1~~GAHX01003285.1.p1  ORF type:complete len:53 (-),score=0.54 GAHX01003285.1:66-224(-)
MKLSGCYKFIVELALWVFLYQLLRSFSNKRVRGFKLILKNSTYVMNTFNGTV